MPLERVKMPVRQHNAPLYDWDELVQEDRVHRLIYTDPAVFDTEMTHIFGGTWVYLAHESQIPNPNDFIVGKLGLRPLLITRDEEGRIRALYNRCSHRGTTICRWEKGNSRSFQCPYHGWNFANSGKLRGVPWPDGYASKLVRDDKYNLAQVPRVESYRGFIFGTLNMAAPPLLQHLGPIKKPIDEWLDRNPGGKVIVCEANRIKYKGNWKLAYDNSGDGYHVVFSHRSLILTENRFADEATQKGMSYYQNSPDDLPMYCQYMGNGHHYKDKRPNLQARPGGLWAIESLHPGMEHVQEKLRAKYGERAEPMLDLAGSEPVNINVFPNLSLLGNHIQVFQPVAFDETDAIWFGTKIEDVDGTLGEDVLTDINALRMRT
jgi:phenylpropionate dioxygenase-like ring-hydroxylating dioxygenase large terminal subunit